MKQIGVINAAFAVPTRFSLLYCFQIAIVEFMFGAEYLRQETKLLPILAIGQLVNALAGPVMYILNMTGKEKVVTTHHDLDDRIEYYIEHYSHPNVWDYWSSNCHDNKYGNMECDRGSSMFINTIR